MRSYFRRTLGENAAEDATALTFVRLARAYEAGRNPAFGLIVNEVLGVCAREAARRPTPVAVEGWEGDEPYLYPVLPATIEDAQFRADFDSAIRALPGDERSAFILTELRGLTERETADVLDTSQPTVHRRAEAARRFVRKEIA